MDHTSEAAVSKSRRFRDTQELIQLILNSPLKEGPKYEVDGDTPMSAIAKKNTDVQTRMFMQIAGQALTGDIKSAQFLMKYGGLEPEEKRSITVELPQFIDDISPRIVDVTPKPEVISAPETDNATVEAVEETE